MAAELLAAVSLDRTAAVPALLRVIREGENQGRRADAARLLAPVGEYLENELDALIQIIATDTNDYVRDYCIEAVGHMRTESVSKAMPGLVKALLEDSGDAARVLLRPGLDLTPHIPELIEGASRHLRDFLARLGDRVIPFLADALSEDNPQLRVTALDICRSMEHEAEELIPIIVQLLGDDNEKVAADAAWTVGSIKRKPEVVIEPLLKLLGHPAKRVRKQAARALGQFGVAARSAIPRLQEAIQQESDPDVQEFMGWCLMRIREST